MTNKSLTRDRAKAGVLAIRETAMGVQKEIEESEGFDRTLAIACGLVSLYDAFTEDAMLVLTSLAGTEMGFKCDKDYSAQVIKDVAIRALMHGANLHGNEFNIIANGCYLTQAYYMRKVKEYPGSTDLKIDIDTPEIVSEKGKETLMRVGGYAGCKINGTVVEIYCRLHPKYGDQRMTVSSYGADYDQAAGKAKKRIAQKLYERIAGVTLTDDSDAPEASVRVIEPEPQSAAKVITDRFLEKWRSEAKKLCKDSLPIAKAIADAYQADEDQRDSMLDAAAQMSEADSVPPEDRVLLKAFANAVFNRWTE